MSEAAAIRPVLGIFWMLVTGLCFVAVTALVKLLGGAVPAAQSAFLRYVIGLVFLVPLLGRLARVRLTPRQVRIFGIRGGFHTLGVILWFFAMSDIPLSEVTAMNYLSPVYVTIAAALLLGERLALRRILAIVAALLGVLLILRPGFREIEPGHLAMLLAALSFAGSYLSAKVLSGEVSPSVIVAVLSVTVTIGLAPFAFAVWVPVGGRELAILAAVAFFATAGHYTMTLAFQAAPLTVTQPVTFLQLVWAVLLGWAVFGEPVDGWVIAGGSMIIGAVVFITWREAALKRRAVTPSVVETKL